jgi:phosphotransferase system  glucose/maltose/N-acetylglucosamine-specific IIC component
MCLLVLQFDVICDSLNYVIFINIVFYTILFYHIFFYWTRKQKQKKNYRKDD